MKQLEQSMIPYWVDQFAVGWKAASRGQCLNSFDNAGFSFFADLNFLEKLISLHGLFILYLFHIGKYSGIIHEVMFFYVILQVMDFHSISHRNMVLKLGHFD
jgi:hypothetical protein